MSIYSLSLNTVSLTSVPASPFILFETSSELVPKTFSSFTAVIMSPVSKPALSAGDPFIGARTITFPLLSVVIYIPIPT